MKRLIVGLTFAALICLGFAGTSGNCRNGWPSGPSLTADKFPLPGSVCVVDPGPWAVVPLVRDVSCYSIATEAAQNDRQDVLNELVRRGVVSLLPRYARVRVAGPATVEWMSIVSPVTGEIAGTAGCVPNSWLTNELPRSHDPITSM